MPVGPVQECVPELAVADFVRQRPHRLRVMIEPAVQKAVQRPQRFRRGRRDAHDAFDAVALDPRHRQRAALRVSKGDFSFGIEFVCKGGARLHGLVGRARGHRELGGFVRAGDRGRHVDQQPDGRDLKHQRCPRQPERRGGA